MKKIKPKRHQKLRSSLLSRSVEFETHCLIMMGLRYLWLWYLLMLDLKVTARKLYQMIVLAVELVFMLLIVSVLPFEGCTNCWNGGGGSKSACCN